MKQLMTSFAMVMGLASGLAACGGPVEEDPAINSSSQALSGRELDYEYYSDATYETQVGGYFAPCGGVPSSWGRRTRFIIGSQTECRTGHTYGCWEIIDGREVCGTGDCVICP
jgi:hypothetical protein